jgi:hypothetical protein
MWASEPGVTYDGAGIGTNVNGHPSGGKRNSSLMSSFIRFQGGSIFFHSNNNIGGTAVPSIIIDSAGNM